MQERDAGTWDREMEEDAKSGRLDALPNVHTRPRPRCAPGLRLQPRGVSRLSCFRDNDPPRSRRDAFGKKNLPASFRLVHAHNQGALGRRMRKWLLEQQEIRAELADRQAQPTEHEPYLHGGRATGVTGGDEHG